MPNRTIRFIGRSVMVTTHSDPLDPNDSILVPGQVFPTRMHHINK